MCSMYGPIGLTNQSGLCFVALGECEDDENNHLSQNYQIGEVPKVSHQYKSTTWFTFIFPLW